MFPQFLVRRWLVATLALVLVGVSSTATAMAAAAHSSTKSCTKHPAAKPCQRSKGKTVKSRSVKAKKNAKEAKRKTKKTPKPAATTKTVSKSKTTPVKPKSAATPTAAPLTSTAVAPAILAPASGETLASPAPAPAAPSAPSTAESVAAVPFPAGVVPRSLYADDFSGAKLDPVWKLYNGPGHVGNGLRRSSAISVDGQGNLVITASTNGDGTVVSGGMARRTDQTYGRFEFRVKTDRDPSGTTNGVVLTWPQSEHWPIDGESDMYETSARADRAFFNSAIHFGSTNQQVLMRSNADATQWHTIIMDWTATAISLYRDGVLVGTVTNPAAVPHVPQHLCLQLDAMNSGKPIQPVHMYVDYVKVWAFN